MGRSPKVGLDYFPMDVHMDEKLELIEAQFGVKGFAVVVKLWQRIYAERGYYGEWDEDIALVFSAKLNGLNANAVSDILSAAIRRGLFDRDLFKKYGILTSSGIQKRYFEAVGRRERVEVIQEYLLIPCGVLPKNVNIKSISADINRVSADRNTQSRVKDSIDVVEERVREEDNDFAQFVHAYQSDIGLFPTSTTAVGDLETFFDEFGLEAICEIIRYTARKNPDSPKNYFVTICRSLLGKGIRTAEQAQAAFDDYERRRRKTARQGRNNAHDVTDADYAKPEDFY